MEDEIRRSIECLDEYLLDDRLHIVEIKLRRCLTTKRGDVSNVSGGKSAVLIKTGLFSLDIVRSIIHDDMTIDNSTRLRLSTTHWLASLQTGLLGVLHSNTSVATHSTLNWRQSTSFQWFGSRIDESPETGHSRSFTNTAVSLIDDHSTIAPLKEAYIARVLKNISYISRLSQYSLDLELCKQIPISVFGSSTNLITVIIKLGRNHVSTSQKKVGGGW